MAIFMKVLTLKVTLKDSPKRNTHSVFTFLERRYEEIKIYNIQDSYYRI